MAVLLVGCCCLLAVLVSPSLPVSNSAAGVGVGSDRPAPKRRADSGCQQVVNRFAAPKRRSQPLPNLPCTPSLWCRGRPHARCRRPCPPASASSAPSRFPPTRTHTHARKHAHTAHKHAHTAHKHASTHARARWHCTHSRSDLLSTFRTAPRSNTTCWRHMQRVSITLVGAGAATPTVQAEEARLSAQAKQLVHQVWPLSLVAAASAWWRWCCCWSWRWCCWSW